MELKINRVLIMTAVAVEREAVIRGLQGNPIFDVMLAGVGPISAASRTAMQLVGNEYDLVISAGIGGGFQGKADIGSIVVADEMIAADLGVQTQEGFQSLDKLELGSTRILTEPQLVHSLIRGLHTAGLSACSGPVLTVSTATGTAEGVAELHRRVPNGAAEAMEGYGVAFAGIDRGLPVLEIRAISNRVGPRDRSAWRIKEALESLELASKQLLEVFR